MKLFVFILFALIPSFAFCDTYVHGYVRKDGAYVEPYHRSSPDHTKSNNYGTQGNINPYTGQEGTRSNSNGTKSYNSYSNEEGIPSQDE